MGGDRDTGSVRTVGDDGRRIGNGSMKRLVLRERIWDAITEERARQHEKFGDQIGIGRLFMLAALTEEVGEVAEAIVEEQVADDRAYDGPRSFYMRRIRAELVQVAAVAVQMIEHIDREEEADRG